jgi:hypothetical protein
MYDLETAQMNKAIRIVAFTGHRDIALADMPLARKQTSEYLCSIQMPVLAIVGMAAGFDMLAARVCENLLIPFGAAIPFESGRRKPKAEVEYQRLISRAVWVHNCSPDISRYATADTYRHTFQKRNEWMVDNCDVLVAWWNGIQSSGTWNCVEYAQKVGRPIVRLTGAIKG